MKKKLSYHAALGDEVLKYICLQPDFIYSLIFFRSLTFGCILMWQALCPFTCFSFVQQIFEGVLNIY